MTRFSPKFSSFFSKTVGDEFEFIASMHIICENERDKISETRMCMYSLRI